MLGGRQLNAMGDLYAAGRARPIGSKQRDMLSKLPEEHQGAQEQEAGHENEMKQREEHSRDRSQPAPGECSECGDQPAALVHPPQPDDCGRWFVIGVAPSRHYLNDDGVRRLRRRVHEFGPSAARSIVKRGDLPCGGVTKLSASVKLLTTSSHPLLHRPRKAGIVQTTMEASIVRSATSSTSESHG